MIAMTYPQAVHDRDTVEAGWLPLVATELRALELRPVPWLGGNVHALVLTGLATGSFKVIPALAAVWQAQINGFCRMVTASAGNFGAGVAYAGKLLGVLVTVVVPKGTDPLRIANCCRYGAEVIVHGANVGEALAFAEEYCAGQNAWSNASSAALLHPFDRDIVMEANAVIGRVAADRWAELNGEAAPVPGEVLAACGGGGLLAGLLGSLGAAWPDCRIVGVEPADAASLRVAQACRGPVHVPDIGTWSAASVPQIGVRTFAWLVGVPALAVDRAAAIVAAQTARRHGLPIELAAALPFAAVADVRYRRTRPGPVLVVASGRNDSYARD